VEEVPPSLEAVASWAIDHDRGIEAGREVEEGHQEPRSTGSGGWGLRSAEAWGRPAAATGAPCFGRRGPALHRADVLVAGL
jgi:hypothetical protein